MIVQTVSEIILSMYMPHTQAVSMLRTDNTNEYGFGVAAEWRQPLSRAALVWKKTSSVCPWPSLFPSEYSGCLLDQPHGPAQDIGAFSPWLLPFYLRQTTLPGHACLFQRSPLAQRPLLLPSLVSKNNPSSFPLLIALLSVSCRELAMSLFYVHCINPL